MRALLIINEVSGDKTPNCEKVPGIRTVLEPAGFQIQERILGPDDDAGKLAAEALEKGTEAILVGGGDGTVSLVAKELVGRKATMGVIPLGTFNNIARSLGMPEDYLEACEVIARKLVKEIDVGRVKDGPYFFEAAGCGLDAELFPLGEEIKGGRWTRIVQFARLTLKYNSPRFRLTFDRTLKDALPETCDHKFPKKLLKERSIGLKALMVVVGNGPYYGGGFGVAPTAKLTDGLLTVAVYRRFSKWELFHHFWSISRGQRKYSPNVETFTAAEVTVATTRPLEVHLDGVPNGYAPKTLEVVPKALRVFAPETLA